MDIIELMRKMHEANTEEEQENIKDEIAKQFSSLPETEKEKVRAAFTESWGEKLGEAKAVLDKTNLFIEMSEISQYISLSAIAKNYFGKSKEWLYQRINGYKVNGRPAKFTDEERKKLSEALRDISRQLNETSFKIA